MTYIGLRSDLPFPIIVNDVLMREALKDKPEIRFMEQDNGTVVCCYLISAEDTFNGPYAAEARGITFDQHGKIISRNLHKFFNLNQRPDTLFENLDWSTVVRIMDKRDGSMICTVAHPGELGSYSLKSKKSFTSDVAVQATKFIKSHNNSGYHELCSYLIEANKTGIFEWTSPVARIVVAYPDDGLTLLHVRDNITGEYMHQTELAILASKHNVPLVDTRSELYDIFETSAGVKRYIEETEGEEGIVVQFASGDMVKIKTDWYMALHQVMTFLRERDIAQSVLDETLDDTKAQLVGQGCNVAEINEIERKVVSRITEIADDVVFAWSEHKHLDRKNFAIKLGPAGENHKYFGLLMQKYSGKEPDYKGFFEKHCLAEEFSLRQLNLLQSVAEEE